MFNLLKKKISSLAEALGRKVEEKRAVAVEANLGKAAEAGVGKTAADAEKAQQALLQPGKKREIKAGVSVAKKVRGIITGNVVLGEADLKKPMEEFELALLEADVEQESAKAIVAELVRDIAGRKFSSKEDLTAFLRAEIRKVLEQVMKVQEIDFVKRVGSKRPFVILVLGPNGAGKSTTMAKLTSMLQRNGKKVIWAASDTFRAAAVEQLEKHAANLNVRVVKHAYGSDPAAVAFDAVKAAEAHGIDAVMIDSAGRQETNRNLMEELKKINRVAKVDMRVYVGEAFTGQALLSQASEFDRALGIDGFVLSKMDADAKGGTAISLLHRLHKPVLFIGTGQGYDDLVEFKPSYIIERVVA